MSPRPGFGWKTLASSLLSLFLLCACAVPGRSATVTPADRKAYLNALLDSKEATQEEVSTRLLAIVPGPDKINSQKLFGHEIVWEGEPGVSRVLVVSFMSKTSYDSYYKANLEQGQEEYVLKKSLWVTVVPELKTAFQCAKFRSCPPNAKRVKQLLGLHPAYDYEVLVEMWVDPACLFRPSPDPHITDHEAEVATRLRERVWLFPSDTNPFMKLNSINKFVDYQGGAAVSFKQWFIDRAESIYRIGDVNDPDTWGWPWTRLGYTYDWGSSNHVGLSEFVIRIDPTKNDGELIVKLVRAVRYGTPGWDSYFRCGSP